MRKFAIRKQTAVLAALLFMLVMIGGLAFAAQQESAPVPDHRSGPARGLEKSLALADVFGRLHGAAAQPFETVDAAKCRGLVPQWIFQTDIPGLPGRGIENTPLVVDGILYVTGNNDQAWAIDGRTGRPIWSYRRRLPANFIASVCCGPVNRGFGILGDRLYMGTLDAHLVALDRKTGKVIWDVAVGDLKKANAITAAPLVVKDKVIIGVAGGDFSSRGYIDAYDAQSGERVWHFNTIPMPGEPGSESWPNADVAARGGGAVWVTGSYDPALNLVYYGTGNPNPDYYGDDREGDNLYTCSLVALDADTGELRWHYQFTPHDVHDWDSAHVPVQADLKIGGQARKVIMVANRNGFFYTLDRESGKLLVAKPFIDGSNWAKEIGKDGRPIVLDNIGTAEKCLPDNHGGTNFQPPTFDPDLGLFFVTAHETCATWEGDKADGADRHGSARPERRPKPGRGARSILRAAGDRSDHGPAALGTSLPPVPFHRLSRFDWRLDVNGVRTGVHRRQRRILLRVRGSDGERVVEVSSGSAGVGLGRRYLHAGWPAMGGHHGGLTFTAFALPSAPR